MMRNFLLSWFILCSVASASEVIGCRVITKGFTECNPYATKYLYAKEIKYDKDRKKLITVKSLPVPEQKPALKIISVSELVQRYISEKELKQVKDNKHSSLLTREELLDEKQIPEESVYTKAIRKPKPRKKLEPEKKPSLVYGKYSIVPGDTLSRIARKFKVKIDILIRLNDIKKESLLRIEQKLTLPLPQRKIDELNKIALKKLKKRYTAYGKRRLRVTATAYTSSLKETDSTPFLAAWNNRLVPGMKSIAVSRDLLSMYGMDNGTKVRISGLPGIYKVRDKMNKRYRKRIDIYMGVNRQKALKWGKRSVVIHW
ncbi:MAG: LysM peptidoglycan-binding domain-containing protein [Sulfurimonas sp.]